MPKTKDAKKKANKKKSMKKKEKKVRTAAQIAADKKRMALVRSHITPKTTHVGTISIKPKRQKLSHTTGMVAKSSKVEARIIEVMFISPKSANMRLRSDHSVVRTALAQPWNKFEFTLSSPTDITSIFPRNMLLIMVDRNCLNAIRFWESIPITVAADATAGAGGQPGLLMLSVWNYSIAFSGGVSVTGLSTNNFLLKLPQGTEFSLPIQFAHAALNSSFLSFTTPYGQKHYSMEYKSFRWIWLDSGATPAVITSSFMTGVQFVLSNVVPANMEFQIDIYQYQDGANVILASAIIPAGATSVVVGLGGTAFATATEIHDFVRFEAHYGYVGPLAGATRLPVGTTLAINIFGRCSTLDHQTLPDFVLNEVPTEEIKVTAASLLITNDQPAFFRNGRISGVQADETANYASWVQGVGQITTASQLLGAIESDPESVTLPAIDGMYGWLKPSSDADVGWQKPWKTVNEITGVEDSAHVDNSWKMDDSHDYLVFVGTVTPQTGQATPLQMHIDFRFNIEFKTTNKWEQLEASKSTPKELDDAFEKLRLMPQFFPNATHVSDIAKLTGLTLTAAAPFGPILIAHP